MTRPSNPEMPGMILDAAERLVSAKGHEALNMRVLAGEVGVTPTTLYYYFTSREHILLRLKLRAAHLLNERIRGVDMSGSPREAIRALGEAYIGFAETHPQLYRLLVEVRFTPSIAGDDDQKIMRFSYDAARALLQGLADRGICGCDPDMRAVIGWVLLHGFASLLVAGTLEWVSEIDRQELKEVFLDYYSTGPWDQGDHEDGGAAGAS